MVKVGNARYFFPSRPTGVVTFTPCLSVLRESPLTYHFCDPHPPSVLLELFLFRPRTPLDTTPPTCLRRLRESAPQPPPVPRTHNLPAKGSPSSPLALSHLHTPSLTFRHTDDRGALHNINGKKSSGPAPDSAPRGPPNVFRFSANKTIYQGPKTNTPAPLTTKSRVFFLPSQTTPLPLGLRPPMCEGNPPDARRGKRVLLPSTRIPPTLNILKRPRSELPRPARPTFVCENW